MVIGLRFYNPLRLTVAPRFFAFFMQYPGYKSYSSYWSYCAEYAVGRLHTRQRGE